MFKINISLQSWYMGFVNAVTGEIKGLVNSKHLSSEKAAAMATDAVMGTLKYGIKIG